MPYFEIEDQVEEQQRFIEGERAMLTAILERTFQDLFIAEHREAAVEWLEQEASESERWTFPWVCVQLGLDVELYKTKTEELIKDSYGKVGVKHAIYANRVSCRQPQSNYNFSRRGRKPESAHSSRWCEDDAA